MWSTILFDVFCFYFIWLIIFFYLNERTLQFCVLITQSERPALQLTVIKFAFL